MPRVCNHPGCPTITPGSRCPTHQPAPWRRTTNQHAAGPRPTGLRTATLHRDRHTCQGCGHRDPTGHTLIADHIVPRTRGGQDKLDNMQTLCNDCHNDKTNLERKTQSTPLPPA